MAIAPLQKIPTVDQIGGEVNEKQSLLGAGVAQGLAQRLRRRHAAKPEPGSRRCVFTLTKGSTNAAKSTRRMASPSSSCSESAWFDGGAWVRALKLTLIGLCANHLGLSPSAGSRLRAEASPRPGPCGRPLPIVSIAG